MSIQGTNQGLEQNEISKKSHSIVLDDRNRLFVSGVTDVVDFRECFVMLDTVSGVLTIEGQGMKLTALDVESGDMTMTGSMSSLVYSEKRPKNKNGLIGKKNKSGYGDGKAPRYITGGHGNR